MDPTTGGMDYRLPRSLALAFGWLLVMRGALVLHSGVWPEPFAMVLSDITGALLLVVFLYLIRKRIMRTILVLMLGFAFFAAGEHLNTHGTLFRIIHIGQAIEPVFVSASVIHPRLLLLPFYCAMVWVLVWLHDRLVPVVPRVCTRILTAAGTVIIGHLLATFSLTLPSNNVVASALSQIPASILRLERPPTSLDDSIVVDDADMEDRFFHREVAEPEIGSAPNILLIMIESLSSGYFPDVSEYHGLQPVVQLEELENGLKAHGFRIYRNMLSLQRQTDRGTYPLLCGDYPRIAATTSKMTDIAEGEAAPRCLPELLADAGYQTAYWQAAPLEFMSKNESMHRIGFEIVQGNESFPDEANGEGWGPPDSIYFPEMARRLQELHAGFLPWFVAMLNVGTHHPFAVENNEKDDDTVIPSASPEERQENRRIAMHEMERALLGFLETLSSRGILNDTLVLITSDEGGGFLRPDGAVKPLDGNFGALAVRPPDRMSLESFADRDAIVSQLDVPLTVLDLIGPTAADNMMGRSLLVRNSNTERGLLLGDAYSGNQYLLLERGRMLACTEALLQCTTLGFDPHRLFGSLEVVDEVPMLDLRTRRALVKRAGLINPRSDDP